jgi:hypothetical protein
MAGWEPAYSKQKTQMAREYFGPLAKNKKYRGPCGSAQE